MDSASVAGFHDQRIDIGLDGAAVQWILDLGEIRRDWHAQAAGRTAGLDEADLDRDDHSRSGSGRRLLDLDVDSGSERLPLDLLSATLAAQLVVDGCAWICASS